MRDSIAQWAVRVHKLARDKGWWKDSEIGEGALDRGAVLSEVPVKLNLIHDEVSEASSEARQGLWDTYWPTISLGDGPLSMKKVRDLVEDARKFGRSSPQLSALTSALGMGPDAFEAVLPELRGNFLRDLLLALCSMHKPEGFGIEMIDNLIRSIDLLEAMGYDIAELMEMKHNYNAGRSYRHGNKRY